MEKHVRKVVAREKICIYHKVEPQTEINDGAEITQFFSNEMSRKKTCNPITAQSLIHLGYELMVIPNQAEPERFCMGRDGA